jgi:endonuclease/exonuclease/phosphatase family metal-dependent hydrolase
LTENINKDHRYTYIYEGNAQTIDHIFVTKNLIDQVEYEQVKLNTEFVEFASDHEPVIALIGVNRRFVQPGAINSDVL